MGDRTKIEVDLSPEAIQRGVEAALAWEASGDFSYENLVR
jgi:hypothetical protein